MITCINQGPNGPSFSKLTAKACGREVTFYIEGCTNKGVSVILDKENVAILARKLLEWTGETLEVPASVTGDL